MASTANIPIFVAPGAHHNADLATAAGLANPGLKDIQDKTTDQIKQ